MLAPSINGRPIMHLMDVQFEDCAGKNVLCTAPTVDLQRTYPTTFTQSGNIQTFMSVSAGSSFRLAWLG